MFKKILIANRGEIACRIIKSTTKSGITSVAIYSTADENSLHVKLADEAYCIGGPKASDSYLNIEKIITIAKACNADAIHPGYGFLSENQEFASACQRANIVFIGPSIDALNIMGSKQLAKLQLEKTNVPLTPGYHGLEQSDTKLMDEACRLGFPVLLKAALGGGGKGMRTVYKKEDFFHELASARREAFASFANDTMLIEKLITNARHIEIQIMADNFGNVIHLYERDCSIQRRHQKVIEEALAANLSPTLREKLTNAAIAVAKSIGYSGAGTVEFLVSGEDFYFMEMNTRLQVEHPVTEMITNLDLVLWQIKIAAFEPLPKQQHEICVNGHAIECRIYAEDSEQNFMPSIGQLHFLKEPEHAYIRIETGITKDSTISVYYDPMLAKLVAFGETREEARLRLLHALANYHVGGVKTNINFLTAILNHNSFIAGKFYTNFLDEFQIESTPPDKETAAIMAASIDYANLFKNLDPLLLDTFAWQMHLKSHWIVGYIIEGSYFKLKISPIDATHVTIELLEHKSQTYTLKISDTELTLNDGQSIRSVLFDRVNEQLTLYFAHRPISATKYQSESLSHTEEAKNNQLSAPMHGVIVAILKQKGEAIKSGEPLIVLEAMKMEHTIKAARAGIVSEIFYDLGAQVSEGTILAAIELES